MVGDPAANLQPAGDPGALPAPVLGPEVPDKELSLRFGLCGLDRFDFGSSSLVKYQTESSLKQPLKLR